MKNYIILAIIALLIGCISGKPELKDNEWIELDVRYCIENNGVISVKAWKTNDEVLLNKMRSAFNQKTIKGLSVAGYTKTNRLIIKLKNKKRWYVFLYAPTSARIRELGNPKNSYSAVLTSAFYDLLNNKLTSLDNSPPVYDGRRCNIWGKGEIPR